MAHALQFVFVLLPAETSKLTLHTDIVAELYAMYCINQAGKSSRAARLTWPDQQEHDSGMFLFDEVLPTTLLGGQEVRIIHLAQACQVDASGHT